MSKYVKICPKCGSTDLEDVQDYHGITISHLCKKCDYGNNVENQVTFFPEIDETQIEDFVGS